MDILYGGSVYDVVHFWEDEAGKLNYDNSASGEAGDGTWDFEPEGAGQDEAYYKNRKVEPWLSIITGDFGREMLEYYASYIVKNGKGYVRLDYNPWEQNEDGTLKEVVLAEDERFYEKNKEEIEKLLAEAQAEKDTYPSFWYPHNTVCVAGIEFRDVKPELTNKWYNFAAIDLSQDGTQTFDLVASNMYVVGTVTVTVAGDEVTVDWKLRKQGTTDANFVSESEFLTFFNSLDAVNGVEPEGFTGPVYQFGQPISIANDLGGDTNVLLYIRNTATYCTNLSYKYQRPIYHEPYDANQAFRKLQREAMFAIMDADTVLSVGAAQ